VNKNVLSLRNLLDRTVCDSEFQTGGAENRKARLEKSVLVNGFWQQTLFKREWHL